MKTGRMEHRSERISILNAKHTGSYAALKASSTGGIGTLDQ